MALYTKALGAVETTYYGRIFKYADVEGSIYFEGGCSQFRNGKDFLDKIKKEIGEKRGEAQSKRDDYNFYLNQTKVRGTYSFVFEGKEEELRWRLVEARKKLIKVYKTLSGLVRLQREAINDTRNESGIITVCCSKTEWVEAHEKMHALLMLASGFILYERRLRRDEYERFNLAIKMLIQSLGPDSTKFESIFSGALGDPVETCEELLAGIVGVAQIVTEVQQGRMTKDRATAEMSDALANFESYTRIRKLLAISEFAQAFERNKHGSDAQMLAIADFYYPAAGEFAQKYNGNLEQAAADFQRFYRMLA